MASQATEVAVVVSMNMSDADFYAMNRPYLVQLEVDCAATEAVAQAALDVGCVRPLDEEKLQTYAAQRLRIVFLRKGTWTAEEKSHWISHVMTFEYVDQEWNCWSSSSSDT